MRKPNPYMFSIRQCTFGMKTVERIKQSLLFLIAMADLLTIIPKCDIWIYKWLWSYVCGILFISRSIISLNVLILTLCHLEFVLYAACFIWTTWMLLFKLESACKMLLPYFKTFPSSLLNNSIESWMNRSNIISVDRIPGIAWSILISFHKLNHFLCRDHLNIL